MCLHLLSDDSVSWSRWLSALETRGFVSVRTAAAAGSRCPPHKTPGEQKPPQKRLSPRHWDPSGCPGRNLHHPPGLRSDQGQDRSLAPEKEWRWMELPGGSEDVTKPMVGKLLAREPHVALWPLECGSS
uniref:Uncharacterized protein n=1 Tax=Myotis myotis TaxID=51298 RepID=A0A7J7SS18_MYOMY|nr:hypothetical protein mMyoMyo1_009405 [Myotis myotis]